MKKNIITLFIGVQFISCQQVKTNKYNIEEELLKLKNQAFCDCYSSISKEDTNDKSSYNELIHLQKEYVFGNDKYFNMIDGWIRNHNYKSQDPKSNLNLMVCLDFYNGKSLNKFIDSVRANEKKLFEK